MIALRPGQVSGMNSHFGSGNSLGTSAIYINASVMKGNLCMARTEYIPDEMV